MTKLIYIFFFLWQLQRMGKGEWMGPSHTSMMTLYYNLIHSDSNVEHNDNNNNIA